MTHGRYFGPFVLILQRMILNDVARLALFYVCLLLTFSTAIVATSRTFFMHTDNEQHTDIDEYTINSTSAIEMLDVLYMLARAPFDDMDTIQARIIEMHAMPEIAKALIFIFEVLVVLVLVNLLIALSRLHTWLLTPCSSTRRASQRPRLLVRVPCLSQMCARSSLACG